MLLNPKWKAGATGKLDYKNVCERTIISYYNLTWTFIAVK